MKKKIHFAFWARNACVASKLFLIMRLTVFLFLLGMIQVLGFESYSQETKISVNVKSTSLKEILSSIEDKTDYYFLYSSAMIDVDRKVTVNVDNKNIFNALDEIFKGSDISYTVKDRQILLSSKDSIGFLNQQKSIKISGKVTDTSRAPLPGVTVVVKGTTNGTITNFDGVYALSNVPSEGIIQFSFVGMKTQEISVEGKMSIDIVMVEDAIGLEEVVAVGYGTMRKIDLTGAVSTIKGETLINKPVIQTSLALQGITPGVTVMQRSGQPGSDMGTIRIRGVSTIADADPYVLIDGIEGNINDVNSNDIESISVLKDAASSAIYGSRASNGVILISTKRADKNKLKLSYNSLFGVQKFTDLPKYTDGYDYMTYANVGRSNLGLSTIWSDEYMENYLLFKNTNPDDYPDTDWQDVLYQGSGFQQQHNISISGGSEHFKSSASLSYENQLGNVKNFEFEKYSIRINNDFEISNNLKLKVDVFSYLKTRTVPGLSNNVFYAANRIAPLNDDLLEDGRYAEAQISSGNNLAKLLEGGKIVKDFYDFNAKVGGIFSPIKDMDINFWFAPKLYGYINKGFNNPVNTYYADGTLVENSDQASIWENWMREFSYTSQLYATYKKNIADHQMKIMIGTEAYENKFKIVNAGRVGYTFPDYQVLDAGSETLATNSGKESEVGLLSFYSRLSYSYKSKYLLDVNIRRDGTSRFGDGHKWGTFPSFSVAYRINEEPFIKDNISWLSNAKIRASWGILGNQTIGSKYNFVSRLDLSDQGYVFGGEPVDGAALTQLNNKIMTWESAEKKNIAIDLGFFNNSLTSTLEYYINTTRDILLKLPIPVIIGLGEPYQNAGEVENKGWEFSLNYNGRIKQLNYNVGLVLSDVKNKITDFKGLESINNATINKEGYAIDSYYGYESDGLFQSQAEVDEIGGTQLGTVAPGDIKYVDQLTEDTDGDGIADASDGVINSNDRIVLGNNMPRYEFGVNLGANYKAVDFSMFIQGVGKRDVILYNDAVWAFYNGGKIQQWQTDYWSESNLNANYPRLTYTTSHNNFNYSDFWQFDASYLRIKTISVGYTVPKRYLSWANISNCRMYIVGNNLFTMKNMPPGWDPERPTGAASIYPITSTYAFGINLTF